MSNITGTISNINKLSGDVTNKRSLSGTISSSVDLSGNIMYTILKGLSAYEVAVNNGFVGTEEEWLESLVGNGIDTVSIDSDGYLTLVFTKGSSYTTPISIKGKNGHSPYIGDNGNWYEYDDTQNGYVDTGYSSMTVLGDGLIKDSTTGMVSVDYPNALNLPSIENVPLRGNVTLSDLGIEGRLAGKVDKVDGKGLSTNDYTSNEKEKLANIESNAQVNVLEGIQKNGTNVTITNKIANITVPTNTNELINGAGFQTASDVTTAIESALADITDSIPTPDWNESNSTSANYIANRTHWREDETITLIPEQTVNVEYFDGEGVYYTSGSVNEEYVTQLKEGTEIYVNCQGNNYTTEINYSDGYYSSCNTIDCTDYMIGLDFEPDSFYINFYYSGEQYNVPSTITISATVIQSTFHKLDSRYLNGTLIQSGTGKDSEIFNGINEYKMASGSYSHVEGCADSYGRELQINLTGEAGATEYSCIIYSYKDEYESIIDNGFCSLVDSNYSTVNQKISSISMSSSLDNPREGTINFDETLSQDVALSNQPFHLLLPQTIAGNVGSHAEGRNTIAMGSASHSEGSNTVANGSSSHAEGEGTIASSSYSHAEGLNTTASGSNSHSEGEGTIAEGWRSHAEGGATKALGTCSHAEGSSTIASSDYSHTEGYGTRATNISSHAEGYNTKSAGWSSHAEGGYYNGLSSYNAIHLTGEANATTYNVNKLTINGVIVSLSSQYAKNLIGMAVYSDSYEIINATFSGDVLSSIILSKTLSSSAITSKQYKLQLKTSAIGASSHAEGFATIANGLYSHAEGLTTLATSTSSHAEGNFTTASGLYSHSECYGTIAKGNYSHAEGNYSIAEGLNSHAEGYNTTATRCSQHVFGEYNILDATGSSGADKGTYIEIVGNGTGTSARSNARTLDWNGNEVLAGKLTVGAAPTNNMDVATKQYVDNATASITDEKLSTGTIGNNVYYPIVGDNTASATTKYIDSTGLKYDATSSTNGYARLYLGNGTASGTEGSKYGRLMIYGTTAYAVTLDSGSPTENRSISLPDKNGTVALTSDVPTKTSDLTNDSGFLTSHQSLSNYVTLNGAQTISGTKTFDMEVRFNAGGGASDISSGIQCAFKTNRSQITNFFTQNIYTKTNDITFYKYSSIISQAPSSPTALFTIKNSGTVSIGTTSDIPSITADNELTTKKYVDDVISGLTLALSGNVIQLKQGNTVLSSITLPVYNGGVSSS